MFKTPFQVPPPVPKKPNVLLLPSSVHSSTNGNTDRQTPQADSPVGLRSPVAAFSPEEFPSTPTVPDMPEQDENHLGTDEESSKESSLQSSLQDSSLTELDGKMASTGIGAGIFWEFLSKITYSSFGFHTPKTIFMMKRYLSFVLAEGVQLSFFIILLCLRWSPFKVAF